MHVWQKYVVIICQTPETLKGADIFRSRNVFYTTGSCLVWSPTIFINYLSQIFDFYLKKIAFFFQFESIILIPENLANIFLVLFWVFTF